MTSNTVQFGARVEVFFGFKSLSVQGHVSFDALFRFSPFHFTVDIAASFSVKVFGTGVFSVKVRGTLDGPAPWHIEGHGSISLLFWSIDVDFSKTWGEARNAVLPPIAVFPLVLGELGKPESWRALLPAGNRLLVSVRTQPQERDTIVLHPLGALQISQRSVPLGVRVDHVGNQRPGDVNRITIEAPGGTGLVKQDDAFEMFAPAQFRDFSDAERLSKPAFARERSGVQLSAAEGLRSSGMVRRNIRYEEIIVDTNFKRFARPFSGYAGSLFDFFTRGASVARSELSQAATVRRQPIECGVRGDRRDLHGRIRRDQPGRRRRSDRVPHGIERPRVPAPPHRGRRLARRRPARHPDGRKGGMSDLGVYSFLPWLRQGLANRIQNADLDASVRARVQVDGAGDRSRDQAVGRRARRRRSRARSRCSVPATSSASTRGRSSASSRATGSRTSSRTTLPTSSSTTRTSRGGTRRRRPTTRRAACGRG